MNSFHRIPSARRNGRGGVGRVEASHSLPASSTQSSALAQSVGSEPAPLRQRSRRLFVVLRLGESLKFILGQAPDFDLVIDRPYAHDRSHDHDDDGHAYGDVNHRRSSRSTYALSSRADLGGGLSVTSEPAATFLRLGNGHPSSSNSSPLAATHQHVAPDLSREAKPRAQSPLSLQPDL